MKETIRNSLYELRAAAGFTQQELAIKLDVTRQTVIAIEKGNYTPSVLLAIKIARIFKKQVEDIFSIAHER